MYETQIIYKITPRGMGKTKWLAEKAFSEGIANNKIYLLVNDNLPKFGSLRFRNFMELLYSTFGMLPTSIAPISDLSLLPEGSVLLIDNLLAYDIIPSDILKLKGKVKKVYITLEGEYEKEPCKCHSKHSTKSETIDQSDKYEQLSIFDPNIIYSL